MAKAPSSRSVGRTKALEDLEERAKEEDEEKASVESMIEILAKKVTEMDAKLAMMPNKTGAVTLPPSGSRRGSTTSPPGPPEEPPTGC